MLDLFLLSISIGNQVSEMSYKQEEKCPDHVINRVITRAVSFSYDLSSHHIQKLTETYCSSQPSVLTSLSLLLMS